MAKQTFTAGQVLTAAQMTSLQTNDYNWSTSAQTASYVLVAADAGKTVTMTNAAATTITVNTSLFTAGDRVAIINLGAGATTITAGTATVNSAGSLVLPQYASGTLWFSSASAAIFVPDDRNSGLTLIKTQTIGTAVSSVTVTNAFSATYDNYFIKVSGGVGSTTSGGLMTLGATTTGYYYAGSYVLYSSTTVTGYRGSNTTGWADVINTSVNSLDGECTICSPFLAKYTTIRTGLAVSGAGDFALQTGGFLANTTSYTDFTITWSPGTATGGTIRVYGYQNS